MPRPEVEPSLSEQTLRGIGYATIVLAVLSGVAVFFIYRAEYSFAGLSWIAAVVVFFVVALSSVWSFAAAQGLAYLRRAEERELMREWEATHEATTRAWAAIRNAPNAPNVPR